jgi:hypothetical protein
MLGDDQDVAGWRVRRGPRAARYRPSGIRDWPDAGSDDPMATVAQAFTGGTTVKKCAWSYWPTLKCDRIKGGTACPSAQKPVAADHKHPSGPPPIG